ncbi:MAG: rod shape-determining protein MreD, partial [Alphaproteobacteria bacterium]|nr:rod shape-determining protein MreD [Alphaproteobacteria bacterium]
AAIYYWTIYQPDLLPPSAVFASGLVLDLLTGAPLGVSSLLLLLTRAVVVTQRRFFVNRLFPFVWGGFTLLAAAAIGFLWLLGSALEGAILDMRAAALQWVLTVACFPAIGYALMRVQRALVPAS